LPTFTELGLSSRILAALARQSIDTPVPVQEEAIPPLRAGRDVVIEAPTGSGKTLAFLVPAIEKLSQAAAPGPRALVVVPTRELAIQVDKVFRGLDTGLRRALLYGGVGYGVQTTDLRRQPDLVIGTPGRLLDMIGKGLLSLARVQYLVLDEADEMLDAGFAPDVERLIAMTRSPQTVLASATMPDWVSRMIAKHMRNPVRVKVVHEHESLLEHGLLRVDKHERLQVLSRLLHLNEGAAILFGRTKHGVKKLNRDLLAMGHRSVELQGNLSQNARERAMAAFRGERAPVLVATNIAARGLDISHVGLVVNYDLPDTPQWLTHRVGRTARMGAAGRALTFVGSDDGAAWSKLRRQGAPDLREVDRQHLLEEGGWRYLDRSTLSARPAPTAPVAAAARRTPRRRQRWHRNRSL